MDSLAPWNYMDAESDDATFCTGDVCETKAGLLFCRTECCAYVEPYCEVYSVEDPKAEFVRWCYKNRPPIESDEDGFGFVEIDGEWKRFPHYGEIWIGEGVEIGRNTCIDRGSLSDTVIGDGTKIDNLVHIGHNAKIGKRCLITAGVIVGGSAVVGDDCYLGIGAVIRNGIRIGNGSTVGMGAVVVKDVPAGQTVIGNPAKQMEAP